jgi:thiol-disulfide isomerase/thioredoxin
MAEVTTTKSTKPSLRGPPLTIGLVLLLAFCAVFHTQIRHSLALHLLLRAQFPRDESFQELAAQSSDPGDFLRRCWATGKVPHRQLVASFLKANAADNPSWYAAAEPLVLGGTLDADMSVRELCLAAMQMRNDPLLLDQAQLQLTDVDPLVRQLGLDYIRTASAPRGVPTVIPLLDDQDLRVVTRAELALVRWTGQDFGVRVRFAIHPSSEDPAGVTQRADELKIRDGIARRKEWWTQHSAEFPAAHPGASFSNSTPRGLVENFTLSDLAGKPVSLDNFRGKVVVLNFWASWCTACLEEIPDLAALHQKMGDRIAVLGISLDGLPDEHHHAPAQSEAEEHSVGKSLEQIRIKVQKAVKEHGITYPVLLDPTGAVGGRFNGGELPTTVVLDTTGKLSRRFVGERNLAVFEAMVNDAVKP